MFGSFYHDSIDAFFDVVGEELLAMPAEQFEALPQELQRSACLAIVDHTTYRSVMFKALGAAHAKQKMIELMERAKEAQGFLFRDLKAKFTSTSEKAQHCLRGGIVWIDTIGFTDAYTDTRTEFALRELYESQAPFVRWTWELVPAGEERDNMEALIESMERKYVLEIDSPPEG